MEGRLNFQAPFVCRSTERVHVGERLQLRCRHRWLQLRWSGRRPSVTEAAPGLLAARRITHTITAHGRDVAQLREGRRLERVGLSERTLRTRERAGGAVSELAQFGHENLVHGIV